jgi:two-component system nitrogen regulation response regulator GlnG
MASGREIHIEDLPPELSHPSQESVDSIEFASWEQAFESWVKQQLQAGKPEVAKQAIPTVEKILIETALQHTHGRKQEAAILLGYGRNTLTRKLKELDIDDE